MANRGIPKILHLVPSIAISASCGHSAPILIIRVMSSAFQYFCGACELYTDKSMATFLDLELRTQVCGAHDIFDPRRRAIHHHPPAEIGRFPPRSQLLQVLDASAA